MDSAAWCRWRRSLPVDLADLPECPARILEKLVEPQAKSGSNRANGGKVHEGGRNDYLYRHGCGMRGRGLSEGEIRAELHRENERHCEQPRAAHEVEAILGSIMRYAAGVTGDGSTEDEGAAFPESDVANRDRLLEHAGDGLRWCEGPGLITCLSTELRPSGPIRDWNVTVSEMSPHVRSPNVPAVTFRHALPEEKSLSLL